MNALLGSMSKLAEDETASIQCLLLPISDDWQEKAKKKGIKKHHSFHWYSPIVSLVSFFFDSDHKEEKDAKSDEAVDGVDEKTKKSGFAVALRIVACARDEYTSEGIARNIFSAFSQYNHPGVNRFKAKIAPASPEVLKNFVFRRN
jgi:hypothetical protein